MSKVMAGFGKYCTGRNGEVDMPASATVGSASDQRKPSAEGFLHLGLNLFPPIGARCFSNPAERSRSTKG
jgi:hypothetical protein